MSETDVEQVVTLMDSVCGGSREEVAVLERLLATTSCAELGPAGYELMRLRNLRWQRSLLDAWYLYREWSPRIEEGRLDHDLEPADFARVAILTCPRLMERWPAAIEPVARAALAEVRRAHLDRWTRGDLEMLARAWLARSMRYSGDRLRAFSVSRRASRQLKGTSSVARAEIASVYASCLRDLGKPHRALAWCTTARQSFQDTGLYREAAKQLLIQAGICWEFWRDGQRAVSAIRQCIDELPSWDRLWRSVAELSLMRYQAEQGCLSSSIEIEPFENIRWEFVRRWTYAKANRTLGNFDLADSYFHEARALLRNSDPECIELDLDYCGLLVSAGRPIEEICFAAEEAAQRAENSPYLEFFAPTLLLLRKVVARRLFSEEIFRYLQRRATVLRANCWGRSDSPNLP